LNVVVNNMQLHQKDYDSAKKNAKITAKKLGITDQEAEARIVAEIMRNTDKQTAAETAGKHDYEIIKIVGCQILKCNFDKSDPRYADHNYNSQYIAPNENAFDAGQKQLGTGQTYNERVISNIKQDPVGASIAGAGMIGLEVVTAGSLPAAGVAIAGAGIGATVNSVAQIIIGNSFDWFSFGMAGVTGAASSGLGFVPALLVNTGGALSSSGMQGQNPNGAMAGAAVGTAIGFPIGSKIESSLNQALNPWYRPQWQDVGLEMSVWVPKNPLPSWFGGTLSSGAQEIVGNAAQQTVEKKK